MSKLQELAYKIAQLLDEYGCSQDVAIYFDGKRLSTFADLDKNYGKWVLQEGYYGSTYTKYANDDTITMTFEGPFYEVVNYGLFPELLDRFVDLIESYGYYYEPGDAWNLALFEL